MTGVARADFFVSRVRRPSAAVTHGCFDDAGNLANDFLHAPKTAARKDRRLMDRRLDQTRLDERFKILAISGLVHFFNGNKSQRRGIDAITQTHRSLPVVEDMAKM